MIIVLPSARLLNSFTFIFEMMAQISFNEPLEETSKSSNHVCLTSFLPHRYRLIGFQSFGR